MKQIFPKILSHAAVWVAFLSIPLFLIRPDQRAPELLNEPPEPIRAFFFLTLNIALICFFYLNYFVLIPRLWTREHRWPYFVSVLGCFLTLELFVFSIINWVLPQFVPMPDTRIILNMAAFASFLLFNLAWASSSGIRLSLEWKNAEERRQKSENANLSAELSQLKSQLNPHFLFNTLNGIYTLSLSKDDAASEAVLKLSHLLRYVMAETSADFVPLERELEHLKHFVALNQMRLTAQTPVHFLIEGKAGGHQIVPLLLLPFIENAFKFGSSARDYSPVNINILIKNNILTFTCQNHIRNTLDDSTGIGIANTSRRLELLYPNRYQLDISNQGGIFNVSLKIDMYYER